MEYVPGFREQFKACLSGNYKSPQQTLVLSVLEARSPQRQRGPAPALPGPVPGWESGFLPRFLHNKRIINIPLKSLNG